ncbi:hypothetical protein GYMLUDRAFT_50503 [Collybiopsis luxurians FD-317 M1]|uniref:Uncharacterized protein n=1 Tax=Collybiopsis luxurians FD-317 M1 TaxID=944289 RepID=A0A0D0BPG5_9AGAR|nr:hypothetical protein GYMLUDRAFT_50503 [Collybiopsis luxurians FD-317 M1]
MTLTLHQASTLKRQRKRKSCAMHIAQLLEKHPDVVKRQKKTLAHPISILASAWRFPEKYFVIPRKSISGKNFDRLIVF